MPKSRGQHQPNKLVPTMISKYGPGFHPDGNCLYLKVDPSGARRWIVRTTIRGHRSDVGIGSPPLKSLRDARIEATSIRAIARNGGDPLAERHRSAAVPTFEVAARQWYEENKASWSNPTHQHQVLQTLEAYAFPLIGSRKVSDITPNDLHGVLLPIWSDKHETANRLRQRIGKVLAWAGTKGYFEGANPAETVLGGLPKANTRAEPREALPYQNVPDFILALQAGASTPAVKLGFEFLILTAARTKEVLGARWDEVDLKGAVWRIPLERMKARRMHDVPLAPRAVDILRQAKVLARGDLAFSVDGARPLSTNTFLKARENLGFKCTPHGFRSSFRDWAAEQTAYPREVAERALAHTVRDKAEAAYQRSTLLEKRRTMMADWALFCGGEAEISKDI